jgi:hypothetical protein
MEIQVRAYQDLLDPQVLQAQMEEMVVMVLQDPQVLLDHQGPLVEMDLQVFEETEDLTGYQENRVNQANQERMVHQAAQDFQDHLGCRALWVPQVMMVNLESQEFQELMEREEKLGHLDVKVGREAGGHLVAEDLQDNRVLKVLLDQLVQKVIREFQGLQERPALKDLPVIKGVLVHRVILVLRVNRAFKDHLEMMDPKDPQVHLEELVRLASKVPQDHRDLED